MSKKSQPNEMPESPQAEPSKLRDFAESRGGQGEECSCVEDCTDVARSSDITDYTDVASGEPGGPSCRTQPLVPAFSICLARKRSCLYAMSFGHQYLCRHPDHAKFLVPSTKHKK